MTNKAYAVIRAFQDKDTLKHYDIGDPYSGETERISELQEAGFLGRERTTADTANPDKLDDERLKHLGGGTYQLPNGERVKGKEKADEALKALDDAAQGAGDDGAAG